MLLVQGSFAQVLPREPIDVERFKPALTYDGFVVTEGTAAREALPGDPVQLGLFVNGALNPLVVVSDPGGIATRFVASRYTVDLLGSMTLVGPVSLGLALPFFPLQTGDLDPTPSGIGDLRVVPKVRLVDDRKSPLGLALLTELRLPTHSDEEFSGGARGVAFAPKLAIDHRFPFGLRFGVNGGVLLRETTTFENVDAGSELTWSAAAAFHPGGYDGKLALGADVHGGAGLSALDFEELPLEGQLFAVLEPRPDIEILGGPAFGLVPGYGTPTFRLFAGIRFAPSGHDADYDGISDARDGCPGQAEDRDGVDDLDGCPDGDREPAAPGTVTVLILGPDGQPLKKAEARVDDAKGAPGTGPGRVEIEVPAGEHVLWVRAKGHVPQRIEIEVLPGQDLEKTVRLQKIDIEVTDDRLELGGTVYFDTASAHLAPESHDLLDEVALVMQGNPSIKKLRVEGHTDSRGSEDFNQELSEARAASVVRYLVEVGGVDAGRLEAQGFGETRPISDILDENRRVEFVIVRGTIE